MREIKHNIYNRGPIIFLLLLIISSCIDETFIDNDDKIKSSYISIRGIGAKVGILKRKSCNSELVIEIDFSNKKLWEKLSHNFTPNIFKVAENFKKTSGYSF